MYIACAMAQNLSSWDQVYNLCLHQTQHVCTSTSKGGVLLYGIKCCLLYKTLYNIQEVTPDDKALRQEVLALFVDAASFEGTSVHFVPAAETCAHASAQTAVNIVMVRGCQFAV